MSNATIAPVRRSVFVQAPPERAFEVFTEGFASLVAGVALGDRRRPGGRRTSSPRSAAAGTSAGWTARSATGAACSPTTRPAGWCSPGCSTSEFEPDPDPANASEVEVTFTREGDGTRVELEHRGFERRAEGGAQVAESVAGEGGWSGLLVAYAEAAQASS